MLTQGVLDQLDYNSFYSLKILAHFRPKVLVDFLHYYTRIKCLTGAIISETHTRHKYIYYLNTILHTGVNLTMCKECLITAKSWKNQRNIFIVEATWVSLYLVFILWSNVNQWQINPSPSLPLEWSSKNASRTQMVSWGPIWNDDI